MRTIVSILFLLVPSIGFAFQQSETIPFYEPHELDLNVEGILPHRVELKETILRDGQWELQSYTYLTVDPIKQFDERMLLINWMATTVFGTGLDLNLVSASDLQIRHRITPKGLPLGLLLESHVFGNEANVVEVNPDIAFHSEELKSLSSSKEPFVQRPSRELKYKAYNAIIWPYVLASIDLEKNRDFILPGFDSYGDKEFYYRLQVRGKEEFIDSMGKVHEVYRVDGISNPDLESARKLGPQDGQRWTSYFVSSSAPFFLGKEIFTYDAEKNRQVSQVWKLSSWQLNTVNPSSRQEELIEEWEEIQKSRGLVIPWQDGN